MSTGQILEFTVADLLAGGDGVVASSTATNDPDGLWDKVIGWPRPRLTAALVAAERDRVATDSGRVAGRLTGRPSVDGH